MSWAGIALDLPDLTVVTPLLLTVISEADLENFPTPTLVRSRGRIRAYTDTSSTPGSFGVVTMGMIVIRKSALAGAAFPSPIQEGDSDWFWWDSLSVGSDAADVIGSTVTVDRIVVDSKAMRKIGNNEVIVFVAELTTCEGTMVVNLCGSLRLLLKAP